MGARTKLNQIHFNGSLFFAAIVGLAAQSFAAFVFALIVLLCLDVQTGNIRPNPVPPKRR